jgi:hypothetical protein
MIHEQKLRNVRRWFAQNKEWIRVTALAKKMKVDNTVLGRALSEDVEQQRNVSPEFLKQITDTLAACSFNPQVNYEKGN